jgi:hypothetical protein
MAMEFLGTSQNKYQYQPLTRETKFGTLDNPMALVYYEGLKRTNTILILVLLKQHSKQRILYIKIHWFCFSYFRTRAF